MIKRIIAHSWLTQLGVWCLISFSGNVLVGASASQVAVRRTPDDGIQPQAAVDGQGRAHLIYFKGQPKGGDIFYVRQQPGAEDFTQPVRVNQRSGSVVAIGTIRGAQMALGKKGRVHVAWLGSANAAPAMVQGQEKTPMVYARLNDEGTGFEPERNLLTWAAGLDGGGSVAADGVGNVYVAWHGAAPDNTEGEAGRAVFLARSGDDGKTFEREKLANPARTGACGCCGMRAFADSHGALYLLYRAATDRVDRDMTLLVSPSKGERFRSATLSKWKLNACPMSMAAFGEGGGSVLAAWEAEQQVQFSFIDPTSYEPSAAIAPPGSGKRKHPTLARNGRGEILLAWTENTGWAKGGSLGWQLFDAAGKPMSDKGQKDGVPVWSLIAAVAKPSGDFVIFY